MSNYSILGIVLCIILSILFFIEIVYFFSSFTAKGRKKIPLHFLGCIATGLVDLYVICTTLKIDLNVKYLGLITLICSILFFILFSIDTLMVEKVEKPIRKKQVKKSEKF
ncbi:MAG: hypothetical protein GX275_11715 [Clostridiales bacterium]|nr:hypothetical protein [Clostridiales bacterium]